MKILWVGPFYSDFALQSRQGASLAAIKWTIGLLRGLRKHGCEIEVLTHCPDRMWPNGGAIWQCASEKLFRTEFKCHAISYINVPIVRSRYLSFSYGLKTRQILNGGDFDAVVCYNSCRPECVATMKAAHQQGVKCYPIILDDPYDEMADGWKSLMRNNRFADGIAFLSYWGYSNYPDKRNLFHIDGGADEFMTRDLQKSDNDDFVCLYTGGMDRIRGLDFIAKTIRKVTLPKIKFVFCGRMNKESVMRAVNWDKRVMVCGMVDEEELRDLSCRANVFLNVRNPDCIENLMNFPSKLLQYLAYAKPVISVRLKSLEADYRKILEIPAENSPEEFAKTIEMVASWKAEEYNRRCDIIREWFRANKTWDVQSGRFLNWITNSGI